jgi:hypothetical protein
MTTAATPSKKAASKGHVPEHVAQDEQHEPEHAAAHVNTRLRKRSRNSTLNREDPFYVNMAAIPADVSVEWKRVSNVGAEDPFYIARMREQGWEPVDPREHPDWVPVPPGYDKNTIIKEGLILMERPMELTREAQAENKMAAEQQVREAEQRLGKTPKDTATRDLPEVAPRIHKEVGRMIAVEE